MPTPDEEFLEHLRATFKIEADEHIEAISSGLLQLEKPSSAGRNPNLVETIYREAHSLKGAARAVEYLEIESICQGMESVLAAWKKQQFAPTQQAFDELHRALDLIRSRLAPKSAGEVPDRKQYDQVLHNLAHLLTSKSPQAHSASESVVKLLREPAPASQTPAVSPSPAPPTPSTSAPLPPVHHEVITDAKRDDRTGDRVATDTVRIPVAKLDAGLREAEDMLVVKASAAQRAGELRHLVTRFDEWRNQWAKVASDVRSLHTSHERESTPDSAGASLLEFLDWNSDYMRSLENTLRSLTAQAEQDRYNLSRHVDDLLEQSKKLLMLPFSTLTAILQKLVRDVCRDQGKEADLEVGGGNIEIDKRILEQMKDALFHILRNCIDHGIEPPNQRTSHGKPARGSITVAASPINGNKVEILVRDDGSGINVEALKQSAIRQGSLSTDDAAALSDEKALPLIFQSELSTSPIVTTLSGRGLGMTIVRAKTEALGGTIRVESQAGQGTTLRIVLPVTLATSRGILIRSSDRELVVPTLNVRRIVRIKADAIQSLENRETIFLDGRPVALVRLDRVLELAPKPNNGGDGTLTAVVLQAADQQVAFIVDEVLHEQEVLVKPLRKPLVRVRNIAGATILGSGKVAPILNVSDLINAARSQSTAVSPTNQPPRREEQAAKSVLVVEDSITSRMLIKGILESAGYTVTTAVDGLDGFATLREHSFDLVVSDVEMPRLNGFDLTSRIRADSRLAELPVILVTALESREQRERGIDAGANAYIIKSTFDQSNLLEVVRRLI